MATFGNTSVGAYETSYSEDIMVGSKFTGLAGKVASISFYTVMPWNNNMKALLVKASDKTIVATTEVRNPSKTTQGWVTFPFTTPPDTTVQDYWLCVIGNGSFIYKFVEGDGCSDSTNSYTTPTNPTDMSINSWRNTSIYATMSDTVASTDKFFNFF